MTRYALVFLLFCNAIFGYSQQMRIGLFRDYEVKRVVLAYAEGSYTVFGDTTEYATILQNEFVELTLLPNDKVGLTVGVKEIGTFSRVRLTALKQNSSLSYTVKSPNVKERKYRDDVEITASAKTLNFINYVDMNHYLAGVVESEGGISKEMEYFKVQALMSRTYALKYLGKHEKEGFDLCDRTHCQAYFYQRRFNPNIDSAVIKTDGMVMVDEHGHLADAFFHANCGGQTCEPDLVWNSKIEYLSSFKDTFCIYTKQSVWEKRIPKNEWTDFLVNRYHYPIEDTVMGPMIFTFNQPQRYGFYQNPALGIPLRDIRDHFKLKSTFFNTYPDGEDVVLRGRGFGHGVGLCQEGAMRMAKLKYSYQQIGLYYFPGVQIVNYKFSLNYAVPNLIRLE